MHFKIGHNAALKRRGSTWRSRLNIWCRDYIFNCKIRLQTQLGSTNTR